MKVRVNVVHEVVLTSAKEPQQEAFQQNPQSRSSPPAQAELATCWGLGFQSTNDSYGISCFFKMQLEESESFTWVVLFASNTTSDSSSTEERVPQRI